MSRTIQLLAPLIDIRKDGTPDSEHRMVILSFSSESGINSEALYRELCRGRAIYVTDVVITPFVSEIPSLLLAEHPLLLCLSPAGSSGMLSVKLEEYETGYRIPQPPVQKV